MRQPLRHAGGQGVAADEPVHGDGGEGEGVLIAVAAEPDEQRLLVKQRNPSGKRMYFEPGLDGLLDRLGHGDLPLAAALATDVEAVVAGVGARPAKVPGPQAAQLGGAQPAIAEHP